MSEELISQLEKLIWHYSDHITEDEERERLVEIRNLLRESNLSKSEIMQTFKHKCEKKHLSLIDAFSKLAIQDFKKN